MTNGRKRKHDSDDEGEDDDGDSKLIDDTSAPSGSDGVRGTVLITLRNVPPYTDWYASLLLTSCFIFITYYPGIFHDSRKVRRLQRTKVKSLDQHMYSYARLRFIAATGRDMLIG
jgi:hypothetical protein